VQPTVRTRKRVPINSEAYLFMVYGDVISSTPVNASKKCEAVSKYIRESFACADLEVDICR
jgi:hypothetical protein